MKKIFCFLSLMVFSSGFLYGQNFLELEGEKVAMASQIETSFLESFEEVSEIATKTKLNIDDMPAFVSILRENDLKQMGVRDAYEALSLIPGVEVSMENTGAKVLIFRGAREKGKVKLLIDGVTINNAYRGSIYHYLDLPIELIKRIEVIRGPGSVLYGSNAISGVINIVTKISDKNAQSEASFSYGSFEYTKGSFISANKVGDYTVNIDGYYQTGNKKIETGPDKSGERGESDERLKDYSVGAKISGENTVFITRVKNNQNGAAFGTGYVLIPQESSSALINNTFFSELQYKNSIEDNTEYLIKAGYSEYQQKFDFIHVRYPTKDLIYTSDYKESSQYLDATFTLNQFDPHELILGVAYRTSKVIKNNLNTYYTDNPSTNLNGPLLLDKESSRNKTSIYLNDQSELSENIDIAAGIRYDDYSDFGSATSPRLGLVYHYNDKTNIKTMYSKAYRAPSFIELYADVPGLSNGDENLKAEKSETIEVGATYKEDLRNLTRINLYHTTIKDVIYRESAQYTQKGKHTLKGIELESRKTLFIDTDLQGAIAYVDGEDEDGKKLPDVADTTGNIQLSHTFASGFLSNAKVKYVSKRLRHKDDTREDLKGYTTLDIALSYTYYGYKMTGTINNILDEEVKYPAPANTYKNDYDREGRNFLLSVSKEF